MDRIEKLKDLIKWHEEVIVILKREIQYELEEASQK